MTQQQLITRSYTARFVTPAFLGDADQSGAWRTPPFKALLRQWWRVAVARQFQYDHGKIREAEGRLFGHAWLKGDRNASGKEISARRSKVRLRLDEWSTGKQKSAPEIGRISLGKNFLPAALYSGYGPVVAGPKLKASAAIEAEECKTLKLAFPGEYGIEEALTLIHRFGTVGGRSRNGWGSFELEGELAPTPTPLVEWREAMTRDWAHGVGQDERGALIWKSKLQGDWGSAMKLLAQLRAELRRSVRDRLLLAYPSTRAFMQGWKATDRVPHSLRFKVRRRQGQYLGVVFHTPCRPSDDLWRRLSSEKQRQLLVVFQEAHAFFDGRDELARCDEATP